MSKGKWTEDEVSVLLINYNIVSNSVLCQMIPNKTPLAIYKKAYKLGLRKSPQIEFLNRSEARRGEKGSNWRGGVKTTKKGYRQLLMPGHPRADRNGYVMEHIAVWEQETGVAIPDNCCIHHLNGIKNDNRIENLCLMLHGAHTVYHHLGAKRSPETKNGMSEARRKKVC